MAKQRLCDVVEEVFRSFIHEPEDLQHVMIGIYNGMCHGELLDSDNIMYTDAHMEEFYKGLNKCIKAAKKIKKFNR